VVYRSLRFQLIAIVVLTVAVVLTLSQWVDIDFSENALEQDMKQRALLVLRTVDSLWGRVNASELQQRLATIAEGDREIAAIDIFRLHAGVATPDIGAHEAGAIPGPELTSADVTELITSGTIIRSIPDPHGTERLRIVVPLHRDQAIVGAAQVELYAAAVTSLKQRLRFIHTVMRLASVALISLALAWFLERSVGRPVAALVTGMRRAEGGELGLRVAHRSGGEFGFLTDSFNRMLSRLESLTAGLEERVQSATRDLAEKNRELQATNEQLSRVQRESARSERLATLGQMAGTIAHELGTPLNSVLGYIQLLRRESLRPEQSSKLAIIESQVQRMIDIIRSVLDRTRDVPVRRAPVAVAQLVSEALALVATQLSARQLTAAVSLPPDLPPIAGDAIGVRQVLLNLLTNAIDAMDGPGVVRIAGTLIAASGEQGPCLELAVGDRGRGMSAAELQRVFEPFYTTKAPGRGTGLGLVIVDHIVHAHGGQVIVDSTPGEGTTMRVRLPVVT